MIAQQVGTTYQQETLLDWMKDSRALLTEHFKELGLDQDLEISPDYDKMEIMERCGIWKIFTARESGKLVGYVLAVFSPHLHYSTSPPMLIVDAYYVSPTARNGTGAVLLKFAEVWAKKHGAIKMYLSCKVHKDHSELFRALGFRLSDFAFIKRL